jgi:periplasmic protein TonB
MFADSLLDSAWTAHSHSRRGWTTLVSFVLQVFAIGGLLLLPLLRMEGMPPLQWMAALVAPARLAPITGHSRPARQTTSNISSQGKVIAPRSVPKDILPIIESAAPPPADICETCVPGGTGDTARNGVLDSIGMSINAVIPPPPVPSARPLQVSHIMEGNLSYRVQPEYPPLARQARVQGTVVLMAVISREGKIENLRVLSGHPLLVQAAMDAVRQWRYRPYYLNDEPVEVETQVTVNFTLSGG